jgi:signal transduction histidine kinase
VTADAPLRVLLVEDNQADARLLHEYLREPGFPAAVLTHVETVAAAIEAARGGAVDAVVLDLTLPDAQGMDAVTRTHAALPGVPIVVLTGLEDQATALRAMQSGAQDYLVKAEASPPLLARALRYALERSRLEAATKRAESSAQAAQLREQFIAILSHDLKAPLSSISMNASLLIEGAEMTERQLKTVARISRSAGRMNRMIRDLLDFTRVRLGGGFDLARVPGSLAEICTQVVEEIETAHPDRTVRLQINGRGWGSWDADRMAQMMSNLIGNGLRYSPAEAPVQIALVDEGNEVSVEVLNQGEAIPPEMLRVIFEPYVRVHTNAHSQGNHGLGLGLYIANQIALAHGGRIDVRSAPGAGTSFRVVLSRSG